MEQRISLVTLGVADLAASRSFFERLGWKASRFGGDDIVFFQCGSIVFGLFPRKALALDAGVDAAGKGFRGFTIAYNARSKAEVDSVLAEAVAAGGSLAKPAHDADWGGYSGYFADLDGHLWEVAWNPHFPIADDGAVTLP